MERNYEYRLFKFEDDWICAFPDLPGCSGVGDTPEEALRDGEEAKEGWLEIYFEEHGNFPEAKNISSKEYSGKILVRTSKSMHRDLVIQANNEGVSLNQYCCQLLAFGLGTKNSKETYNVNIKVDAPEWLQSQQQKINWKNNFSGRVLDFAAGY